MSVLLIAALIVQFLTRRYVPPVYWLGVVLISVVGTLITDNLSETYSVALQTTTIVFSIALAATFAAWYASERTLSIHTSYTIKREAFYWLALLFVAIAIAHFSFKLNAVLSFWLAYIMTRPLGASIGDLLSQKTKHGGLGLGTTGTSIIFPHHDPRLGRLSDGDQA